VSDVKEWSKTREKTEPEDKIYYLLGMLDIFMAPSYGEGIDNATKRLDDKLERASTKTSFIVPYGRNGNFVGYESQLAKLEQMVLAGQQATKSTITGPSGIAKSQLALELAYRTREKHKNCAVFWISAADISFSKRVRTSLRNSTFLVGTIRKKMREGFRSFTSADPARESGC